MSSTMEMTIEDVNNLDEVVHELGIEDSDTTPAEAVRELKAEIERLRAALKPFADAVYNDNGDMTITTCNIDAYAKAYFTMLPR